MTNIEKIDTAFTEVFSINRESLREDFSNETAEIWDSIRQLGLATSLEDSFDIMFDPEDILNLTSYSKAKEILSSKYNINLNE